MMAQQAAPEADAACPRSEVERLPKHVADHRDPPRDVPSRSAMESEAA